MTFCDGISIYRRWRREVSAFRIPETVHLTISLSANKKEPAFAGSFGGERGIRTLDALLEHTPLAGVRLQPLGHLSLLVYSIAKL